MVTKKLLLGYFTLYISFHYFLIAFIELQPQNNKNVNPSTTIVLHHIETSQFDLYDEEKWSLMG